MIALFIDSDVILDALLRRPDFYLPAINILDLAYEKRIKLYTSAVVFVNTNYFLDKFDRANKLELLKHLRSIVRIIEVSEKTIDLAINSNFTDFEDAVQFYAAKSINADYIITRNLKDYKNSTIPVLTAEQFLRTL